MSNQEDTLRSQRPDKRCFELPRQAPLGVRLVLVGHRLSALIERRLSPLDINRTQAGLIMALLHHPDRMAHNLAGPVQVEPPSVTRAMQSLERRGIVARKPHPTDGRASLFSLTDAGKDLAAEIERVWHRTSEEIVAGLDAERRDALAEVLDGLSAQIETLRGEAQDETDRQPEPLGSSTKGSDL